VQINVYEPPRPTEREREAINSRTEDEERESLGEARDRYLAEGWLLVRRSPAFGRSSLWLKQQDDDSGMARKIGLKSDPRNFILG
jgi:hypothetical protein